MKEDIVTHLTRFLAFLFLAILCCEIDAPYSHTANAQDADANQGEATSIPHAEVITQLLDFTGESVEDCSLPCFAGIRPGETTLPEIQELAIDLFDGDEAILERFDRPFERDDDLLIYTMTFNRFAVSGSFSLSFMILPEEETLHRFYAHLNHPENWFESSDLGISKVMSALGEPDEVYLSISAAQPPYFDIAFGYEIRGTLFRYKYFFEPEQLTQSEEPIPLCGSWSNTYSADIWIQAVDEELYEALLEENLRLEEDEDMDEMVYRAFWPLERMTNWNIEDLTEFLVDNPEWCFDALSYEELLESGYSY
jgi:hypothetical protein